MEFPPLYFFFLFFSIFKSTSIVTLLSLNFSAIFINYILLIPVVLSSVLFSPSIFTFLEQSPSLTPCEQPCLYRSTDRIHELWINIGRQGQVVFFVNLRVGVVSGVGVNLNHVNNSNIELVLQDNFKT